MKKTNIRKILDYLEKRMEFWHGRALEQGTDSMSRSMVMICSTVHGELKDVKDLIENGK